MNKGIFKKVDDLSKEYADFIIELATAETHLYDALTESTYDDDADLEYVNDTLNQARDELESRKSDLDALIARIDTMTHFLESEVYDNA